MSTPIHILVSPTHLRTHVGMFLRVQWFMLSERVLYFFRDKKATYPLGAYPLQDESSSQTRELGCVLAVKSQGHEKQIELCPPEAKPFLQVIIYDEQGNAEVTNQ